MKLLACVSFLAIFASAYALPPFLTVLYANIVPSGWSPIFLGHKIALALTPCDPKNHPSSFNYQSDSECLKRCSGHCLSCNGTCIFGSQCVCAASIYCVYDPNNPLTQSCQPIENFTKPDWKFIQTD
ncbi:uncharacterized protein LOC128255372 [Drosophila gunungcola]|uniref:Uncharacterized protein n=1 Tax=Drosophila gunungcola TaxID=103775 RepID=A0A9Q0BM81_9MUSC|nr:uncharacterized protein LOC128255372 [Drosophila gunungcola]KAI8037652.1 hypothetical protein M5D96_009822 [Drosophila gunungcola]